MYDNIAKLLKHPEVALTLHQQAVHLGPGELLIHVHLNVLHTAKWIERKVIFSDAPCLTTFFK